VCQMASFRKFDTCFGIEYEAERASWAYPLANEFFKQLQCRSYGYSNIQIDFGDFFKSDTTLAFLRRASLVWVNNVKFADINFQLLTLLDKYVPRGCVVVSFVSFLTRQTRTNETGFGLGLGLGFWLLHTWYRSRYEDYVASLASLDYAL
jgi:hypothetical protein